MEEIWPQLQIYATQVCRSLSLVKKKVRYFDTPFEEQWRISLSKELMYIRSNDSALIPGFNDEEVNDLLKFVCVM